MAIQIGGKDIVGLVAGTSSGNKDVVEVWQGSSSGNKLIWQRTIPDNYVLATDADFSGTTDNNFVYIGTDEYVEIPERIKGRLITSTRNMFADTTPNGVKGVRCNNPRITNMAGMFQRSTATSIDLSQFHTPSVTNMTYMFANTNYQTLDLSTFDNTGASLGYMFSGASATTGYARTQVDADRFNISSGKPSSLRFVVK